MDEQLREAAALRAGGMARAGDRPSQRRNAAEPGAARAVITRARPVFRAAGEGSGLDFSGYASVTDAGYPMWDMFGQYTEIVARGAFTKTLLTPELDVPLVLQHADIRRVARTTIAAGELGHLSLAEDDHGLLTRANLDPADPDVAYIAPKMRAGLIDEMSFKFTITAGEWSPDWSTYRIDEVDIHRGDVAIVAYGASPHTAGAALRITGGDGGLTGRNLILAHTTASFPRAYLVTNDDLI